MSDRITSFAHDGLEFDVVDSGPLDGDVVVLLHGFPERASSWSAVAARLNAAGLRTLAPDQRGYSPGARPRRRRDYRLERLVADVAALAERVGGPVHLVGHDWGAAVAWAVAASRPDLVRTLTAFSVPHPAAFAEAVRASDQALRSWYVAFFQLPVLPELLLSRRSGLLAGALRRGGMRGEEVDRLFDEVVGAGALSGGLGWYRALPYSARSGLVGRVRVPTTMVWSDRDAFLAREGVERASRFVAAPYRLVVLPGVSHWIPTQAPEAAAAAVLSQVAAAGDQAG